MPRRKKTKEQKVNTNAFAGRAQANHHTLADEMIESFLKDEKHPHLRRFPDNLITENPKLEDEYVKCRLYYDLFITAFHQMDIIFIDHPICGNPSFYSIGCLSKWAYVRFEHENDDDVDYDLLERADNEIVDSLLDIEQLPVPRKELFSKMVFNVDRMKPDTKTFPYAANVEKIIVDFIKRIEPQVIDWYKPE